MIAHVPFRSSTKDPTREPETSKSWVMMLKQEGDNWLSADAQQRVQLQESMSATLEPPVGNEDLDAPSHSAQSDSVPRPKRKKKTTCVHVTFACLYCWWSYGFLSVETYSVANVPGFHAWWTATPRWSRAIHHDWFSYTFFIWLEHIVGYNYMSHQEIGSLLIIVVEIRRN